MILFFLPVFSSAQSPAARDARSSISGRVLFAGNDQGVSEARVELKFLTGGWAGAVVTDRSGRFSIEGLGFGAYIVTVSAQDCATAEERVQFDYSSAPLLVRVYKTNTPPSGAAGGLVSVRDLRIPAKARKAFDKGTQRLSGKDATASVGEFERAIKEFPGYFEAYYEMGVAEVNLGHAVEAVQAFQKSIDLSGGHFAPPHFALGLIFCYQNDFNAAETVVQRGLALDPGSANGEYALAWAQFGLNRLVEAEKSARATLLRKANFPETFLLLAEIHRKQNNMAALVEDLDAYIKLDPSSPANANARTLREMARRSLAQAEKTSVVASANP
jgi:tetratricopeptide (TPR) repeat protein